MKRPTYDQSAIPSITWTELPPSCRHDGGEGSFDDFSDIKFRLICHVTKTHLRVANKVHTPQLKTAIKNALSQILTFSSGFNNYMDPGTEQSIGIHFDIDHEGRDLTNVFQTLYNTLSENKESVVVSGKGVKFHDTLSAGFSEREFMVGVIRCQQRHGDEIPGIGQKIQGEVHLTNVGAKKSRPDALEYDEAGNVISVIECQSGIKDGATLDNDHFGRIMTEYPYLPDIEGTVRKVVVIAGGYTRGQVRSLRGSQEFEAILLQTAIEDNFVVLRPYKDGD